MVFIDGRFEVSVEFKGEILTFFSETKPDTTAQIELSVQADQIVPLKG